MKLKNNIPIAITFVLLIMTIAFSIIKIRTPNPQNNTSQTHATKSEPAIFNVGKTTDDMKGVWITHMELNMTGEADQSEKGFTKKFNEIAQNCKSYGFNTLIVQVRPFCDALYQSNYFPYSHILTGEQGENPGYDPLKVMCKICQKYGLKIHAWINPYRITLNNVPEELSDDNPAIQHSEYAIETESTTILDPSNPEARELIVNGIEEIIEKYDVDGIQFDDYFYPVDIEGRDSEQYEKYKSNAKGKTIMDIETWRKVNVNMLIAECYIAVHKLNKSIVFGISPQGNLENNSQLSADVISWSTAKGYVDYICPQLYFSLENPKLSFEDSLDSWTELELAQGVKLYAGLAGYKAGTDADEETWLDDNDVLKREYEILKNNSKVSGVMLYSYSSLLNEDAEEEINNLKSVLN